MTIVGNIDINTHGYEEHDSHELWMSYPIEKRGAVLVLLSPTLNGRLATVLTKRSQRLRTSPGMSAFPGGKVDLLPDGTPEDEWTCALREAFEETGFEPSVGIFTKIGVTPCYLALGSIVVRACVAVISSNDGKGIPLSALCPKLSSDEVELAYTIPLDSVLTKGSWYVAGETYEIVSGHLWKFHDYAIPTSDMLELERPANEIVDDTPVIFQGLTAQIMQDVARLVHPDMKVEIEVLGVGANELARAALKSPNESKNDSKRRKKPAKANVRTKKRVSK